MEGATNAHPDTSRYSYYVDDAYYGGVLEELRRPLATADTVLKNADTVLKDADTTLLSKNAPIQQDLRDALQEITVAARSLRILMDYLERHPDSLIRGKTEAKP